jgi:three-Cys-motif partner protein
MAVDHDEFFEEKREWSKIKDKVLGSYMPPYFEKVKRLGKKIVVIDAFAGQGKFKDGSAGSPLILSQLAKKHVGSQGMLVLVNKKKLHHDKLTYLLQSFIEAGLVKTINGDSNVLLNELLKTLSDETLLLYLDPFGLKGCDFNTILPYLNRDNKHSSELLMNISVPIIHRLAAKNVKEENETERIKTFRQTLTSALGGDYWKKYLMDDSLNPNQQIESLMFEYKTGLLRYLPFVGYCPVYESHDSSTLKYYIFFASRHADAAILMNDIMFSAYWHHNKTATTKGTLFAEADLDFVLPANYLETIKKAVFEQLGSDKLRRIDLWEKIVIDKFMRFKSSDFKSIVSEMCKKGICGFVDTKGTGRLNDDSIIYVKKN